MANKDEIDQDQILAQKEAAIRGLGNYALLQSGLLKTPEEMQAKNDAAREPAENTPWKTKH